MHVCEQQLESERHTCETQRARLVRENQELLQRVRHAESLARDAQVLSRAFRCSLGRQRVVDILVCPIRTRTARIRAERNDSPPASRESRTRAQEGSVCTVLYMYCMNELRLNMAHFNTLNGFSDSDRERQVRRRCAAVCTDPGARGGSHVAGRQMGGRAPPAPHRTRRAKVE